MATIGAVFLGGYKVLHRTQNFPTSPIRTFVPLTKLNSFIMVAKATIFFLALVAFVGASPAPTVSVNPSPAVSPVPLRMSHLFSAFPSPHVSYRPF